MVDKKKSQSRLLIDADACPVKDEIGDIATELQIEAVFVASYSHFSTQRKGQWVTVDPDREAADLYIANHVKAGDIVVTWDMGLASLLTTRRVYVLTPNGKVIKDEEIPNILHLRHLSKKERTAGRRVKGPKAFTDADRMMFRQALNNLICTARV